MPQKTEKQKRQESLRRQRWNKAEKPYFSECLSCLLSCEQIIQHGAMSYNILTCPKAHKGEPAFPYKFMDMKKEYEQQEELINGKGKGREERNTVTA